MVIPSSKLVTVGERAFVVTCSCAWNLLPPDLWTANWILVYFFDDHVLRSFYESM